MISLLNVAAQLDQVFDRYVIVDRTVLRIRDASALRATLIQLADAFERTRTFVENALRGMARAGGFQHGKYTCSTRVICSCVTDRCFSAPIQTTHPKPVDVLAALIAN
jgi:hypothetical protein